MFRLIRLRGVSMRPTLEDGDLLLAVRPGLLGRVGEVRAGRLGLLRLPGNRPIAVKRLAFTTEEGWWVERDNPAEGIDSWLVGAVEEADLIAVIAARVWPRPRRL